MGAGTLRGNRTLNYRHSYHAGNFADVMKHVMLVALIDVLRRKPSPFSILDTHAGIGLYDLSGREAQSTGEWREGIGRLLALQADPAAPPCLQQWLDMVRAVMAAHDGQLFYPGSPVLAARLLRPGDSLTCCELHPQDQQSLKRLFRHDPAVSVHGRDGYEAITALLPPRHARRGLVLMDPPFEQPGEFNRLAQAIITARRRFATGMIAAWYPIKHRAPTRAFLNTLKDAGQRNLLAIELTLRPPLDPARLNGSGLLIANPPFQFEHTARAVTAMLARHLGDGEAQASVEWVVPE